MTKTFWNTSNGPVEREARDSLEAADLDPEDGLAARTVLMLAIMIDQQLRSHGVTFAGMADYGDSKLAYHVTRLAAELGRAMDRCLLTPQSRLPVKDSASGNDPFVEAMSNVRSIARD